MFQRRDLLLQFEQFGFRQFAHGGIGEQRLRLLSRLFGGAQVADAGDHRLDIRQFAGGLHIGVAGDAFTQQRAQFIGAGGDAVQFGSEVHPANLSQTVRT